jgi:hypothetical protein
MVEIYQNGLKPSTPHLEDTADVAIIALFAAIVVICKHKDRNRKNPKSVFKVRR